MSRPKPWNLLAGLVAASIVGVLAPIAANACPFCSAVAMTFSEEVAAADVAVFAKLLELPPAIDNPSLSLDVAPAKAKLEIVDVLKGSEIVGENKRIEVTYFGDKPVGTEFLVMGIGQPKIEWATPIAINERVRKYIATALKLPKDNPVERLAFFQDYLEDDDELLTRDSYDEFAKTPYDGVKALKDRMHKGKLVTWIKNPEVTASHRRLYLTMLGVCGGPDEVPMLEEMIRSTDRKMKIGLDAMIACYLTLKGAEGLPLVDELYLKDKNAEYTDTYAAIMALRFHGQESNIIPRQRIVESLRYMLDRPELADLVIPDLARWQDWGSMERLVTLFKQADKGTEWVRVPVVNFLRACPEPKAKEYLEELAQIDPDAVKRANTFGLFGAAGFAAAPAGSPPTPGGLTKPPVDDSLFNQKKTESGQTQNKVPDASGESNDSPVSVVNPSAAKVADTAKSSAEQPSQFAIIALPLGIIMVLMAVFWMILRRPHERTLP